MLNYVAEEEQTMEKDILEGLDRHVDFMPWLVEELTEIQVADQVIATITKCVWSVSCPEGCEEQCGVELEQVCWDGSSMQDHCTAEDMQYS
jgi:hypothetical protein